MNTTKRKHLVRTAVAVAALTAMAARVVASEGFEFNLAQYELSFGQGRARHAFQLSNFVPGDRFGDLALGENGRVRIPLYSTDPKAWTLFRNSEAEGASGSQTGGIGNALNAIFMLGMVGAMIYGIAAGSSDVVHALEPDIEVPQFLPPPTTPTTTSASTKPAKK